MTPAVPNPSRRAFLRRMLPSTSAASDRRDSPEAGHGTRPARFVARFGRSGTEVETPTAQAGTPPAAPLLAVIAGRTCLAYQHSFCSVCRERCPVPGAVVIERGLPRIDPARCDGCRVCHEVCPAPVNAIRLVPRPAGLPWKTSAAPPATPCFAS